MKASHALLCVFLCLFAPLREKPISANQQPTLDLDSPDFKLLLVKTSQTVAAFEPKNTPGFDFTPSDRLAQRSANRYHHLGDLLLRVRAGTSLGLWLTLDAGTFEKIAIDTKSNNVRVTLSRADHYTSRARLRIQQPARIAKVGTYAPRGDFVNERDAFTIPLGRSVTMIELGYK